MNKDLSLINIGDLIRFTKKEDSFILKLIVPSEDNNKEHLDHLNGALIEIVFNNISNYHLKGRESDNYTLLESNLTKDYIFLKYKGINYTSSANELEISFNYSTYKINQIKDIEGPDA